MTRYASAAAAALVLTGACGTSQKETLADCAGGWWLGTEMTCAVACLATTPPAACAFSDCEQVTAMRLGGSEYVRGIIVTSVEGRTMEWVGGVEQGAYSVSEGVIQLGSASLPATCGGGSLVLDGATYRRACPALSTALDASAAESWSPKTTDGCP